MANATSSRKPVLILALRAAAVIAMVFGLSGVAAADTFIMPKREGLRNEPMVLWGATTLPNHNTPAGTTTTYRFLVYDGSTTVTVASGNVTGTTERSYINFAHAFTAGGTYLVTLEVRRGAAPAESAAVEVQIVDPANLPGPGTKALPIGPGSNETYRQLRINIAIQDGLRYLWTVQNRRALDFDLATTSWGNTTWWTALAVTAFENHGYRLANDGSAPTGIYERFVVQRGLTFIINNLEPLALSSKTLAEFGDPCVGVGIERVPTPAPPSAPTRYTCTGLTDVQQSDGYTIGIAMMPLAASSALNRVHGATGNVITHNKTYREILQRLANSYAFGQLDTAAHRGGWGYNPNDNRFDGSVMGWAILGLLDAQAANIVVPQFVEDELEMVLNAGTINDNGSFDYNVTASNNFNTTHMSKAGIPLQGLFMVSREDDSPATKQANAEKIDKIVTYIRNRWTFNAYVPPVANPPNSHISDTYSASGCLPFFNKGCAYSMFNIFKGLKLQNIATLPGPEFRAAGPGNIPANDWHADYEDYLINRQVQGPTGGDWALRAASGGNPAIPVAMMFSPQGTNDAAANAAIAELLLAGVALVLPDADRFATIGLSPALTTIVESNQVTLTAKAESSEGAPVPGATVNFSIISGPNAGAFGGTDVTDANGEATFTYTDPGPIPSFGTDRIQANIGTLLSNIVEVVWEPFNRPPVANPDDFTVDEDGVLNGSVITNDTDPDNDVLTAALVGPGPANGAFVFNTDGSFIYTPTPDFCGQVAFSYDLNDGLVDGNVAAVTINVACVNDAPVAANGSAATVEGTTINGEVSSTDVDGGAPTYSLVVGPSHGTLVFSPDGTYAYTPSAQYHGPDSFTFSVSDGNGGTDTGDVNITVTPLNDPPVPNDSSDSTAEDTPGDGSVGATDADGDTLTYAVTDPPDHGTLVLDPNTGAYIYTPDANYHGPDSFSFSVSDGTVTVPGGDVSFTVTPVNDPPVPNDSSDSTTEDTPGDGSVGGTDVDGDTLTYAVTDPPDHGTLVLDPTTGAYVYTPDANYNGPDSFSFSVSDGIVTEPGGDVTITVTPVNDPPVPNDSSDSTAEDTPGDGSVGATDADGDTLTYVVTDPPDHGTLVLDPTTGAYVYTPDANYNGPDAFSFSVSDGIVTEPGGDVTITVTPVNDPPVPNDGTATTPEDTAANGTVGATDVDGDTLTYVITDPPDHGTLVLNPDGSYVYTPDPNYNGSDSFSFGVSDGTVTVGGGDVTIVTTAVNDLPVCTAAGPSVASLWPPNHQLVNIDVLGVTDPVEGSGISIRVTGIFQDEPTNTAGDGNTLIDGYGVGTATATVRAERSGSKRVPGDGRMYYIYFTGTDAEGGECQGTVQVGVPHDLGKDHVIGAGGPIHSSTGQ